MEKYEEKKMQREKNESPEQGSHGSKSLSVISALSDIYARYI